MKRLLPIILLFSLLAFQNYSAVGQINSNSDINKHTLKTLGHNNVKGYLEYLPPDYNTNPDKRYPVIVFLHGTGERGNGTSQLYKVAKHGLPKVIENGLELCFDIDGAEECFIAISPQLFSNVGSWGGNATEFVIDHIVNNYRVDEDRIYLTGHSLGGIGTYKFAKHEANSPNRLAAIAPIAANGINNDTEGCLIAERNINIRAYHSQADESKVTYTSGERSFNYIMNCSSGNAEMQLVTYETLSHNGTPAQAFKVDDVYDGENIFEWFLSHRLNDVNEEDSTNTIPDVNAGDDIVISLPQESLSIIGTAADADGHITSYLWNQVAGESVSMTGTTSNILGLSDLQEGEYTFSLMAIDDEGGVGVDSVNVNVTPPANLPPLVDVEETITVTLPQDSVCIHGVCSDVDGSVSSYQWSQLSGETLALTGQSTSHLTLYQPNEGNYTFSLTVADDDGAVSMDTVSLNVNPELTSSGTLSEQFIASKNIPYLSYLPLGYAEDTEGYPVLIYLHSQSAEGTSLDLLNNEGPMFYINQGQNFCFNIDDEEECFIVIAPQINMGDGFYKGKMDAIYNEVLTLYNSDPDRIYVTGYDQGGTDLYARMLDPGSSPDRYAGIGIVSAKTSGLQVGQNQVLNDTKLWVGHSAADEVFSYNDALHFYNSVTASNSYEDAHFQTYTGYDHDMTWRIAFDPSHESAMYEWLFSEEQPVDIRQENDVITEGVVPSKNLSYLEYLPPSYDESADAFPVLIYLHSQHVEGEDLNDVKEEGPMYYIAQNQEDFCFTVDGEEQCFIVIAPQVERGSGFYKGKMNALYDHIINNYNSDPDRIFITGFDQGGTDLYARMLDADADPNRYAGIGVVGTRATSLNVPENSQAFSSARIWVGHGEYDERNSIFDARDFYGDLRISNANPDTLFIEFKGESHDDSWQSAYNPSSANSMYEWLFSTETSTARGSNGRNGHDQMLVGETFEPAVIDYVLIRSDFSNALSEIEETNYNMVVYNYSGQTVLRASTTDISNQLDGLKQGNYLYRITNSEDNHLVQVGRIVRM